MSVQIQLLVCSYQQGFNHNSNSCIYCILQQHVYMNGTGYFQGVEMVSRINLEGTVSWWISNHSYKSVSIFIFFHVVQTLLELCWHFSTHFKKMKLIYLPLLLIFLLNHVLCLVGVLRSFNFGISWFLSQLLSASSQKFMLRSFTKHMPHDYSEFAQNIN